MTRSILISTTLAALSQQACTGVDCGDGTIERNGTCQASDETVGDAVCGPNTKLEGDRCVPDLPPTTCDPTTTTAVPDPVTGVITCVGTGGGGCSATFACPQPMDASHQTICGQLFDLEDGSKFQGPDPSGTKCPATATADGPCSLNISAYDAVVFGTNPQTAPKLATDPIYIDDCGRYRVPNIAIPGMPFIGLGIDDADSSKMGPGGTTNTVGVATPKIGGAATSDFDGWIATKATTDMWEATAGTPPVSGGLYVPIYRKRQIPSASEPALTFDEKRELQDGVAFTKSGSTTSQATYFTANDVGRHTTDTAATVTGKNGTALIKMATVMDSAAYSGTGGIDATCRWELHAGASLPFILFVQEFRPVNAIGMTCDR